MLPPRVPTHFPGADFSAELRGVGPPGAVSPARGSLKAKGWGGPGVEPEDSTGNRKEGLPPEAAPLPPGLTCPGAAQMPTGAGGNSTNSLTHSTGVSLRDAWAADRRNQLPGLCEPYTGGALPAGLAVPSPRR